MEKQINADKTTVVINSLIASARVEGYKPSEAIKKDLRDYMDGRVSIGELVERTKRKYAKVSG